MKKQTEEWVEFAENDFSVAQELFLRKTKPVFSHVCFNAQQCAEKYLKALLIELGHPIERTHNLARLLDLVVQHKPELELHKVPLIVLSRYAVEFRYPGEEQPDKHSASDALAIAADIRGLIRLELGLEG
ncbi:MAG TPA: HEPN domain-containing protein [Candidatus Kapabacteria bacterium]|nr:HEPN domain-containing protein [Candidatus Kapabacteria bacterium]